MRCKIFGKKLKNKNGPTDRHHHVRAAFGRCTNEFKMDAGFSVTVLGPGLNSLNLRDKHISFKSLGVTQEVFKFEI